MVPKQTGTLAKVVVVGGDGHSHKTMQASMGGALSYNHANIGEEHFHKTMQASATIIKASEEVIPIQLCKHWGGVFP